jgi:hypothetical protein
MRDAFAEQRGQYRRPRIAVRGTGYAARADPEHRQERAGHPQDVEVAAALEVGPVRQLLGLPDLKHLLPLELRAPDLGRMRALHEPLGVRLPVLAADRGIHARAPRAERGALPRAKRLGLLAQAVDRLFLLVRMTRPRVFAGRPVRTIQHASQFYM